MGFKLQINEMDAYLSIKAIGSYTLPDLRDFLDRAAEEAEKRGYRPVLLDIYEVTGSVPILDMFELVEHCASVWNRRIRVAILTRDGGLDKFFENVARNRGIALAIVPNQDAALAWLRI